MRIAADLLAWGLLLGATILAVELLLRARVVEKAAPLARTARKSARLLTVGGVSEHHKARAFTLYARRVLGSTLATVAAVAACLSPLIVYEAGKFAVGWKGSSLLVEAVVATVVAAAYLAWRTART